MTSFLELHRPGQPLLIPNPWDVGSAKILAALDFTALATTSGGYAATLGQPDGSITRDEALAHAAEIAAATDLPVSADLENGFAHDADGVAATIEVAHAAGIAGCSIEDYSGDAIYPIELATERIAAAVEAARGKLVITARSENFLRGREDLADTITRLQSYQAAGAHVLYAPGLTTAEQIRTVVSSVDRPVNVLALPGAPSVAELADLGVARISVGGAFAFAALGALVQAATEFREQGTYGFWSLARTGRDAGRVAFG